MHAWISHLGRWGILIALVVFALTQQARAGISAMRSWAQLSPDGSRVFVMIVPDADSYEKESPETINLPSGKSGNVHDLFKTSGMYDAKSLQLLWPVNWYSQKYDIQISPDGSVVVDRNRFAFTHGPAISFYRDGKEFKQYNCSEFLTGLSNERFFPYETWDWHTRWYDEFETNRDRLILSTARRRIFILGHFIDLGRQEVYQFDFSTGQIIDRQISGQWYIWAYVVAAIFTPILLCFCMVQAVRFYLRRKNRTHRGFPVVMLSQNAKLTN